jgi:hypothetical protein
VWLAPRASPSCGAAVGATLRRSIAGRDLIRDSGSSKQPRRFKPTRNSSSGHMGWTRSVAMLARTLRRLLLWRNPHHRAR